jgi:phosphatidylserine/phosphatidylglycerophosphate/cardiolipin synthase-like enzyme
MASEQLTAFEMQVIAKLAGKAGLAARLLDIWASLPSTSSHTAHSITSLAQLGVTEEGGAQEILSDAENLGLLICNGPSYVSRSDAHPRFARLALALYAIDHYTTQIHRDASLARVVLTRPPKPSALETQLDGLGWRTGDLEPTAHAFVAMVQRAKRRIVVMTPFFDAKGAGWLKEVFAHASPGVSRILVLRSLEDHTRLDYPSGLKSISSWLVGEGVLIYNYSLSRGPGYGRETFHAKVVLCDDDIAYVGSSNINAASLERSMEMGVAIEGKAARDVAMVIDAILQVATISSMERDC